MMMIRIRMVILILVMVIGVPDQDWVRTFEVALWVTRRFSEVDYGEV